MLVQRQRFLPTTPITPSIWIERPTPITLSARIERQVVNHMELASIWLNRPNPQAALHAVVVAWRIWLRFRCVVHLSDA